MKVSPAPLLGGKLYRETALIGSSKSLRPPLAISFFEVCCVFVMLARGHASGKQLIDRARSKLMPM